MRINLLKLQMNLFFYIFAIQIHSNIILVLERFSIGFTSEAILIYQSFNIDISTI